MTISAGAAPHTTPQVSIPCFPDSLSLDLSTQALFALAYKNTPPPVSDMAFCTLFGWQHYFGYRCTRVGDQLFLFFEKGKTVTFLPPLLLSGSLSNPGWEASFISAWTQLSAWAQGRGLSVEFRYFPEVYTKHISPERFLVTPERDCADYIYQRSELVELTGSDYAAKRNLIRQFTRNFSSRYETLSSANLEAAGRFINEWQEKQKAENGILGFGAYCMACRLVENFSALALYGGLLFANDTIVAATIGSMVPDFVYPDGKKSVTMIVHHENALTEYKGAYQVINQQFCAHLPESVAFINREEDLGIPGLRKAKLSYHPALLIEKSRIELITR